MIENDYKHLHHHYSVGLDINIMEFRKKEKIQKYIKIIKATCKSDKNSPMPKIPAAQLDLINHFEENLN